MDDRPAGDGLKVINASLFRMGTKSMAEAYQILGYRTHHALDEAFVTRWDLIEEAAEGKWPEVPGARPRGPYTRKGWDAIWGAYDAVSDLASPFAADLALAYPDAKVVVVQKDFDAWWPSFASENLGWRFFRGAELVNFIASNLLGTRAGHALAAVYLGFFGARDVAEIHENARWTYERYFAEIRQVVPPERLLEYEPASGWEPLCRFLDKDVPDVQFPRVNEKAEHREMVRSNFRKFCLIMIRRRTWSLLSVVFTAWYISNKVFGGKGSFWKWMLAHAAVQVLLAAAGVCDRWFAHRMARMPHTSHRM